MRRLRRWWSYRLVRILAVLLLLPYGLTVVYTVPFVHPPSTLMVADFFQLQIPQRRWVPLGKISPALRSAVVAAEDDAFCEHWGMDFTQLRKSLHKAQVTNKPVRATSTISQQLAKNLFLWHGRSWVRKVLEVPLTFWLELVWSKARILEVYLNVVEWGDGVYGAEAAARFYFRASASSLSYAQAVQLATTLPNPDKRNAVRPGPAQAVMSAQLLQRMQHSGPDLSCIH